MCSSPCSVLWLGTITVWCSWEVPVSAPPLCKHFKEYVLGRAYPIIHGYEALQQDCRYWVVNGLDILKGASSSVALFTIPSAPIFLELCESRTWRFSVSCWEGLQSKVERCWKSDYQQFYLHLPKDLEPCCLGATSIRQDHEKGHQWSLKATGALGKSCYLGQWKKMAWSWGEEQQKNHV